jgi:tetratricopeptide (TPR) repeat protein
MTESGTLPAALQRARALLATQPAKAAEQAAAILQAVPGHPEAVLVLGVAHRRQGRPAEARALLEPLARAQPNAAAAQFEWGVTQAELGETQAAIASLRRAVALKPQIAPAWRLLGDLLTLSGEPALADAAYAQQIRASVHDPALMQAANALVENDLPTAEKLLRAHLVRAPTDVAALRMLAEAGTRLGRYADAESLLARCLALAPGFSPARHNYALVLLRQARADEANPHVERLLAEDPLNPGYRGLAAAAAAMTGDYARAIDLYAGVLRDYPQQPKMWMSVGHSLKTVGRTREAIEAYRRAARLAPGLGEAHWSLANVKTEPFTDAEIATMQAQLARPDLSPEDRFHLEYALGRALEQRADYARSFRHYQAGARLRRQAVAYSADRTAKQLDRTRALMTPAFFAARQSGGNPDPSPIFIVGLPRSGSTLIEQILASHSQIEGTMELPEMANISRDLGRTGGDGADTYPECLAELTAEDRTALGQHFIERTRVYRKTSKPFFIDKMPNNFVHVGLIHLILPNARIIDARRHPMAACFSAYKQHFARGQHFSYDLTELGRYYRDYTALMAHFDAALPGRVHRVDYEAMVQDTETEVRRLLVALNLQFEPTCMRFHENDRAVRTASSEQVRQPIFREGLAHWRHYEPFLAELKAALRWPDDPPAPPPVPEPGAC